MEKVILKNLESKVGKRLITLKGEIEHYTEAFNQGYDKFFLWYAEGMFKCKKEYAYYSYLMQLVKLEDLEMVKGHLRHCVEHLTDDLMYGSLRRSSSNDMVNLAHILELEVKQEIVKSFTCFLREIDEIESKKQ